MEVPNKYQNGLVSIVHCFCGQIRVATIYITPYLKTNKKAANDRAKKECEVKETLPLFKNF